MADITSYNLNAALLDQQIAGAFAGKKYAFVAVVSDTSAKTFGVGIAVKDEPGYHPIESKIFQWDDYEEATAFCKQMNLHIGLDAVEVARIVTSTMRRA